MSAPDMSRYPVLLFTRFFPLHGKEATHQGNCTEPKKLAEGVAGNAALSGIGVQLECLRGTTCSGVSDVAWLGSQFASPQGHHTLLTSATNERWKAVRKSVATAFSVANMRALYPKIRDACAKVRSRLCAEGSCVFTSYGGEAMNVYWCCVAVIVLLQK